MLIHGGFRIKLKEVASQLAPEDGILHHNLHYLDPCVHYLGWSFWTKKVVYHLYEQTMVDKTVDRKLLARAVFVSDYSMRLRWRCVEKVLALWVPSFGIVEAWTFIPQLVGEKLITTVNYKYTSVWIVIYIFLLVVCPPIQTTPWWVHLNSLFCGFPHHETGAFRLTLSGSQEPRTTNAEMGRKFHSLGFFLDVFLKL